MIFLRWVIFGKMAIYYTILKARGMRRALTAVTSAHSLMSLMTSGEAQAAMCTLLVFSVLFTIMEAPALTGLLRPVALGVTFMASGEAQAPTSLS